ncbi:MAG: CocE/NonD family hydrolase [Clostridiales bacterium]|nr:CocE/NonD family hydrolase [Clostridiales bacterium]
MSIGNRFLARYLGLPPAKGKKLDVQKDIAIPMRDGVILYADLISPAGAGAGVPAILLRTPYTARSAGFIRMFTDLLAEAGYHVLVQNCRGTWGSGGEWFPFGSDREDGLDTLDWMARQPWFNGSLGMFGVSYWGFAQLACGPGAPDCLKALVPQMAASRLYNVYRRGGIFSFLLTLSWNYSTFVTQRKGGMLSQTVSYYKGLRSLAKGFSHLPVSEADSVALGFTSPFFQGALMDEDPADDFWSSIDYSSITSQITAPVHFVAGWYDFFLPDELADYRALRDAGRNPYLTIGPWTHASGVKEGFFESLAWYEAYLKGDKSNLREKPVKVCVMGTDEWACMESWPPKYEACNLYLHGEGGLSEAPPGTGAAPSRYWYDPADPTPYVGGAIVTPDPGPRNNTKLESRADILTFTSGPMEKDMTIMGPVSAGLFVRSTLEHTDYYVRLCDVSPDGKRSTNICEGITRLKPGAPKDGDGIINATITLTDTAYCFKAGHRIRIQVSSGAHPLFLRNLGTGEPDGTGVIMQAADQEIFHDAGRRSAITLPMIKKGPDDIPHSHETQDGDGQCSG